MTTQPAQMTQPLAAPFADYPCPCRSEHAPPVPFTHAHHVWPLYAGGPNTPDNIAYICPATHDWVHVITRAVEKVGAVVPRDRTWPHHAYALAVEGWNRRTNG